LKGRSALALAVSALIFLAVRARHQHFAAATPEVAPTAKVAEPAAPGAAPAAELAVAAPAERAKPAVAAAKPFSAPLAQVTPSREALRAEAAKNPHQTPTALIAFSISLHERLKAAIQEPDKAPEFFDQLENCVRAPEQQGNTNVESLCLQTARRLSENIPNLTGRLAQLESGAEPEALKLSQAVDRLRELRLQK
jgi:hypothetical protein